MRLAALGAWVHEALFEGGTLAEVMEQLQEQTGETVILAAQSDLTAQYVHVVRSGEPLQFAVPPGTRRPLAGSGLGWLLLSARSDAEIERLRRRINAAAGPASEPLSREGLALRIAEVRQSGYAFSKGVVTEGVGVIGVLLPKGPFGRVFALGVGGPVSRLEANETSIVQALRASAAQLAT
jgi:DNA-binding IclR family transcriptional regulator